MLRRMISLHSDVIHFSKDFLDFIYNGLPEGNELKKEQFEKESKNIKKLIKEIDNAQQAHNERPAEDKNLILGDIYPTLSTKELVGAVTRQDGTIDSLQINNKSELALTYELVEKSNSRLSNFFNQTCGLVCDVVKEVKEDTNEISYMVTGSNIDYTEFVCAPLRIQNDIQPTYCQLFKDGGNIGFTALIDKDGTQKVHVIEDINQINPNTSQINLNDLNGNHLSFGINTELLPPNIPPYLVGTHFLVFFLQKTNEIELNFSIDFNETLKKKTTKNSGGLKQVASIKMSNDSDNKGKNSQKEIITILTKNGYVYQYSVDKNKEPLELHSFQIIAKGYTFCDIYVPNGSENIAYALATDSNQNLSFVQIKNGKQEKPTYFTFKDPNNVLQNEDREPEVSKNDFAKGLDFKLSVHHIDGKEIFQVINNETGKVAIGNHQTTFDVRHIFDPKLFRARSVDFLSEDSSVIQLESLHPKQLSAIVSVQLFAEDIDDDNVISESKSTSSDSSSVQKRKKKNKRSKKSNKDNKPAETAEAKKTVKTSKTKKPDETSKASPAKKYSLTSSDDEK